MCVLCLWVIYSVVSLVYVFCMCGISVMFVYFVLYVLCYYVCSGNIVCVLYCGVGDENGCACYLFTVFVIYM